MYTGEGENATNMPSWCLFGRQLVKRTNTGPRGAARAGRSLGGRGRSPWRRLLGQGACAVRTRGRRSGEEAATGRWCPTGLVAGRDTAGEVEFADRALGAVADRVLEAVLVGIEAEKRSPTRLEPVGLGATFDTPQHWREANHTRPPGTNAVFAPSGKFRSPTVP